MTTRTEIAEAASLAGLTNVTPHYRQSLKTGDGFVRLASRARGDNGFGWVDSWEVWLAVPSDAANAEKWIETNLGDLMAAIDTEMNVTSAAPAELALPNAVVNGLIIAGTREG